MNTNLHSFSWGFPGNPTRTPVGTWATVWEPCVSKVSLCRVKPGPHWRREGVNSNTHPPLPKDVIGADSSWSGRADWQTTTVQTDQTKTYTEEFQLAAAEKKKRRIKGKTDAEQLGLINWGALGEARFGFGGSPWKAWICSCCHVAYAAWAHWEVRHKLTQYTPVITAVAVM